VLASVSPDGPGPVADRTDVTLVQGTENIGFGPAHNLLSAEATGTYLFILNNDTIVEPRALERMVVRSEAADRPGAPGLPGSSGAIRCHCTSLNTFRSKADLHFSALNQISPLKGIPLDHMNVHRP